MYNIVTKNLNDNLKGLCWEDGMGFTLSKTKYKYRASIIALKSRCIYI